MEKISQKGCGPAAVFQEKGTCNGHWVSIWRLSIPFKFNVVRAISNTSQSEVILIQIQKGEYSGWGEVVSRRYVTGASVHSLVNALKSYLVPTFLKASCMTSNSHTIPIWLYSSKLTEKKVKSKAIDNFIKNALDNSIAPIFMQLIKKEKYRNELNELRQLINEFEKNDKSWSKYKIEINEIELMIDKIAQKDKKDKS